MPSFFPLHSFFLLIIRGIPNVIFAQSLVLTPDQGLAIEKAEPLPHGVQPSMQDVLHVGLHVDYVRDHTVF